MAEAKLVSRVGPSENGGGRRRCGNEKKDVRGRGRGHQKLPLICSTVSGAGTGPTGTSWSCPKDLIITQTALVEMLSMGCFLYCCFMVLLYTFLLFYTIQHNLFFATEHH